MKTSLKIALITLVALMVGPAWMTGPANAGVKELKFQSTYPPPHPVVKLALDPWFKEVEKKSNGQLKIVFFPPRAIVKENETFEGAEAGLIDIGTSMCGRNPGKFPLHAVAELPLIFPNATVASQVLYKTFKQFPELQREFKEAEMLWQWSSATAHILTTKKQVKNLEDLKGLKIIGYTPMMLETIKALGGNPLQVAPMDAYLALERGMADGIIMSFAGARALKLIDSCKYAIKADVLTITFYAVISPITLEGLTKDQKKVIAETTGLKMAQNCGQALDKGDAASGEWLAQQGMEIIPLPAAERARWLEAVKPVYEKVLTKLEKKGHKSARKILKATQAMTAEASK